MCVCSPPPICPQLLNNLDDEHTRDMLAWISEERRRSGQAALALDKSVVFDLLASGFDCSMRSLQLQGNHLAGQFSARIYDLAQLRYLGLGSNEVTGT